MRHLDLFSGIGGFALAARNVGWQTVAFCESEPFCQAVLRKHWPDVPIHPDVRELTGDAVGSVDIITGGYPCQPFSLAGKRGGAADDRHLWPEFARLIRELRPRWVLGENVAGHITMGLDDVLTDLEGLGYTWEAFVIPAAAVDARHRRDRVWIAAHANSSGIRLEQQRSERGAAINREAELEHNGEAQPLADPDNRLESEIEASDGTEHEQRSTIVGRPELATGARAGDRAGLGRGAARHVGDELREVQPVVADTEKLGRRQGHSDAGGRGSRASEAEERRGLAESCRWLTEPGVGRVVNGLPGRLDRIRALGNAIVPQVAEEIFRAIAAVN